MKTVTQQSDLDYKAAFSSLWEILQEIHQQLEASFDLHPDLSTKNLHNYSSLDGNVNGSLKSFSGQEIDWLVYGWLKNPKLSFGQMGLAAWLRPHIWVPHLVFELGTVPDIFFYMNYIPRRELLLNPEYVDQYYEPVNQTYLTLQGDSRLSPFVSQSTYKRQVHSPIGLCYNCPVTKDSLKLIRTVAQEMLDRWLIWVYEAEPVPEAERAALAKRDLFMRRTIAERDPGKELAVQMLGKELTEQLVRALWGGDR